MKGKIISQELLKRTKLPLNQRLQEIIDIVAQKEGFQVEILPEEYIAYYVGVNNGSGHRCVDGRAVLEQAGEEATGFSNEAYNGAQFPGGTCGVIGAIRVVLDMSETEARSLAKGTCDKHGISMGDHTDDDHGRITNLAELVIRTAGCGNQDAGEMGRIPMYEEIYYDGLVADRITWLRENGGSVPPLSGNHFENLPAINLDPNITFGNRGAVLEGKSVFNLDLATLYNLAGLLYDDRNAQENDVDGRSDFQDAIAHEVVRDYFQTLTALDGGNKVFVKE